MEQVLMLGNTKIVFDDTYCVEDPQPILDRLAEIIGYRIEQNKRLPDAATSKKPV